MVFQNFLLRLGGMVRIQVRGAAVERFLNICSRHNIILRDIDRIDLGELHVTLSLRDFRRLRTVMGRTGCRVHLLSRHGAPFTVHRFRRRYALYGGFVALGALIWVLMSFIWIIRIPVPAGLSGAEIERHLQELGVHVGMRASSFDAKLVQQEMMQRVPELSFIALNRHGNRIDVELHAREKKPEMLDDNLMTDVRATKTGVLTRVDALDGYALKKPGETVQQGEIVISSLVPATTEIGKARLTHASGTVEARVWYANVARRATTTSQKHYTGKKKTRFSLVFGKNRINLYLGSSISVDTCDKIIDEMKIVIADSVEIPVRLVRETYWLYETEPYTPDPELLRGELTARAQERLQAKIDGEILASSAVLRPLEDGIELTLYAESLEQIGQEAITTQELPPPGVQAEGENSQ